MTENLSKKERLIIDAFQKAFDLINKEDNISLYCFLVKRDVENNMISTVENLKGSEEDVFSGMCGAHDDEKMSATKNLLMNFFNYNASQLTRKAISGDKQESPMKIIPKGDA